MPFKHTWTTYDKRGSGDQKYAKYDNQLVVIVAKPLEKEDGSILPPSTIYLSKLVMDLLGNPDYIEVMKDGEFIGFKAGKEGDKKVYVVNRPTKLDNEGKQIDGGRPFLSCRSVIKKWKLKAGAYTAEKDNIGAEILVYFNARSEPSKVE